MKDYENLLGRLAWRRDYFNQIDFTILAKEYAAAISAIEELQQRIQEVQEVQYEDQNQEEKGIGISADDDEHR